MERQITIRDSGRYERDKSHEVEIEIRHNEAQATVVALTKKELTSLIIKGIAYLFGSG